MRSPGAGCRGGSGSVITFHCAEADMPAAIHAMMRKPAFAIVFMEHLLSFAFDRDAGRFRQPLDANR